MGFWQVRLDQKSSYVPHNIQYTLWKILLDAHAIRHCSAPEVWQQWMNQLIEGLPGIEVIADDFLVCGSGDTTS